MLLWGLVAVVLLVLGEGAVRQRRSASPVKEAPKAIPAREGAPTLSVDLDKAPLSYFSDFWHQLGNRASRRIVLGGRPRTPALVLTPSLAITSLASARRGDLRSGDTAFSRVVAADAETGLVLLELALPGTPFEASDPTTLHPGQLVAAVSVSSDNRVVVAPGNLTAGPLAAPAEDTSRRDYLDAAISLSSTTSPAAVVDLDGRLVGIAYQQAGVTRVLSAGALLRLVERLQGGEFCHAIEVGELADPVRAALGVKGGVVVERLVAGAWPQAPPFRPGDVLLEWNGTAVHDRGQFRQAYEATKAGVAASFLARRGPAVVRGSVPMLDAYCLAPDEDPLALRRAGLRLAREDAGWRVIEVRSDLPAARAGIEPQDLLVAVEGRSVAGGPDGLRPLEQPGAPLLVTLRRDGRARVTVLERVVAERTR